MILAIDPSLSGTAVVLGDDIGDYIHERFSSDRRTDTVYHRIQRYRGLVSQVAEFIGGHDIGAVFIEGYSFASDVSRARFSAEYGGLLRAMLLDLTADVYEIPPLSLKKFAGGVGRGDKQRVIQGLQRRYGVVFNSDDGYDAFGLYRLGLCVLGHAEPQGRAQAEVVEQVKNPRPKKRKPRKSARRKAKDKTLF